MQRNQNCLPQLTPNTTSPPRMFPLPFSGSQETSGEGSFFIIFLYEKSVRLPMPAYECRGRIIRTTVVNVF